MKDAGCGMWMQDAGCRMPDAGCGMCMRDSAPGRGRLPTATTRWRAKEPLGRAVPGKGARLSEARDDSAWFAVAGDECRVGSMCRDMTAGQGENKDA